MTAPLTGGRPAAYRLRVGAESVPMGLREGLTELRRPNRAASHSERGFFMARRVDYPARGSRFSVGRFFAESACPATRASAKCSEGRHSDQLRSLAMLESRSCRRAFAGGQAP